MGVWIFSEQLSSKGWQWIILHELLPQSYAGITTCPSPCQWLKIDLNSISYVPSLHAHFSAYLLKSCTDCQALTFHLWNGLGACQRGHAQGPCFQTDQTWSFRLLFSLCSFKELSISKVPTVNTNKYKYTCLQNALFPNVAALVGYSV